MSVIPGHVTIRTVTMLSHVELYPRTLDRLFVYVKCRFIRSLDRRKALCYKDESIYGRASEGTVPTIPAQG